MILEVIDNIKETWDSHTIRFKLDKIVNFKPGQFSVISLEVNRNGEKKIENKAYSMSSIPGKDYLEIMVKKVNNGTFSNKLADLKPGEKVEVKYPYGTFIYQPEFSKNIVLIGAGSGISPLMSITRYAIDNKDVKTRLIYTNKTEKDIIFHKEFIEMEKNNENFKAYFSLTQQDWDGIVGRCDEKLLREIVPDYMEAMFYICGPPKMVNETRDILLNMGVEKEKIKMERYD